MKKPIIKKTISLTLVALILASLFGITVSAETTVQNGTTGNDVGKLQAAASLILGRAIVPDKVAGSDTVQAIKDIQKKFGLTQNGIADTSTWAKINSVVHYDNTLSGKTVRFETAKSRQNQVVVIQSASKNNGAKAISWNYNASKNDQWVMELQSDYTYKIKNINSGLYLEVASFSTSAGAQVQQWQYDNQRSAHWYVFWVGNDGWSEYCLVNACSGMALNLQGSLVANGTNIIQWTPNISEKANCWYIHIIEFTVTTLDGEIVDNNKINYRMNLTNYSSSLIVEAGFNIYAWNGVDFSTLYKKQFWTNASGINNGDWSWRLNDALPSNYYLVKAYAKNSSGSINESVNQWGWFQITAESYAITYNLNSGSGSFPKQEKFKDVSLTLHSAKPTRTGYAFSNWKASNGTTYASGASYTRNEATTLTAQWTANIYKVTLKREPGTGGTATVNAIYASPMPAITPPERTGYIFGGYYTGENGAGTQYYTATGTSVRNWDIASDTTLNAKWTAVNLTLNYSTWNPKSAASSITVTVTSNTAWTVHSNATWLTVSPSSGTGNGSFTITATANTGTTSRTGAITVTGGGISGTITVTQETASANLISITLPYKATQSLSSADTLSLKNTWGKVYKFNVLAGQTVTITMNSSTFDSYLYLLDSNFSVLAQDDDGNGGLNSKITYTIASSGTYYIQATQHSNTSGNFDIEVKVTQTVAIPTVLTREGVVSSGNVKLKGEVASNGGVPLVEYGFVYGTSETFLTNTVKSTDMVGSIGPFGTWVNNLPPGKYYFRAYAKNVIGTTYGNTGSFVIVGIDGIEIQGSSTWNTTVGKACDVKIRAYYSDLTSVDITSDPALSITSSNTAIASTAITGGYCRVTAKGAGNANITFSYQGKSCMLQVKVEPQVVKPVVVTLDAAKQGNTATLYGNVSSDGGGAITSYGFEYGTSSGNLNQTINVGTTTVYSFSKQLTNLSNGTYYFRAFAQNSAGKSLGDIKSFQINVQSNTVYRAVLIGNNDYPGTANDLQGCINDAKNVKQMLELNLFGTGAKFEKINLVTDATRQMAVNAVQTTFAGATSNDVSYFYYSGHGSKSGNTSYLCTTDVSSSNWLSVNDLESLLSAVPGKVVVFLDSCHSGGFVNKALSTSAPEIEDEIEMFNDDVLSVFGTVSRDYLTGSKYRVITASSKDEYSYESYNPVFGKWMGQFTSALLIGCGQPKVNLAADTNGDEKITMTEAVTYTRKNVSSSSVKASPETSDDVLFEYSSVMNRGMSYGDDLTTAHTIMLDDKVDGTINNITDVNCFKVNIETSGMYSIKALSDSRLKIGIYNESNVLVKEDLSGNMSITTNLTSGVYYIYVESLDSEIGRYSFSIEKINNVIMATGIQLNKITAEIVTNSQLRLVAEVSPYDCTDKSVIWSSNNTSVVTVSGTGTVTAVSPGTATVTAKTSDELKSSSCVIEVVAKGIQQADSFDTAEIIVLDSSADGLFTSAQNEKYYVFNLSEPVTVNISNDAEFETITTLYDVSGQLISQTDSKRLSNITLQKGKYYIKLTTDSKTGGEYTLSLSQAEKENPLLSISLNKSSVTLEKNKTETLTVSYNPIDTTDNKIVTWSTSNANVATVVDGIITAKNPGTAIITAKVGTKEATCNVTVTNPVVPTNPTSPTTTTKPTVPAIPITNPVDPTKPTVPAIPITNPVDPTKPIVATTNPTDPIKPTAVTTNPTDPAQATSSTSQTEKYLLGDGDQDGKISVKDATVVQKHVAKIISLQGKALKSADADGDGKVTVKDATVIQKYVAKMKTNTKVGEEIEIP